MERNEAPSERVANNLWLRVTRSEGFCSKCVAFKSIFEYNLHNIVSDPLRRRTVFVQIFLHFWVLPYLTAGKGRTELYKFLVPNGFDKLDKKEMAFSIVLTFINKYIFFHTFRVTANYPGHQYQIGLSLETSKQVI